MIVLLLVALLLIGAIIVVVRPVSNKLLRYSIVTFLSVFLIGIVWVMWMAAKSGEM